MNRSNKTRAELLSELDALRARLAILEKFEIERKRVEEALRESEILAKLFSTTHILGAHMDKHFNFLRVNRAYAEADGREPDFFVGKNHFDLYPDKENELIFRRVVETGEPYSAHAKPFEYAEHPERGVTYWDWTLLPVTDSSEQVEGVLLCLVDVTERIQAEGQLRKYSDRLEKLVDERTVQLVEVNKQLRQDITGREQAEKALQIEKEKAQNYLDLAGVILTAIGPDEKVTLINRKGCQVLGYKEAEILGENWFDKFLPEKIREGMRTHFHKIQAGKVEPPEFHENPVLTKKGEKRTISWRNAVLTDDEGNIVGILSSGEDITERKRAEEALEVSNRFLRIANRHTEMSSLLRDFVGEVQNFTGCDAIGIRILDEQGNIPYQAYVGFSETFYESESPLSIKSDQCMCTNVIKGTVDPNLPFYTERGSVYMNSTTSFLATVSEAEKGKIRNVCNQAGYESVALVPIPTRGRILGLIHMADFRENMVPLERVEAVEAAAMQLGTAVARVQTEETVRDALEESRKHAAESSALLESSRAILEYQEFEAAGRVIFNSCKRLIGATTGYIAIAGKDGTQNEFLFLDSGGFARNVDLNLLMPIRALRAEAYSAGKPVYMNRFADSEWTEFLPPGHAKLDNIMFAPLLLEGRAVGVLGIANKPGGFTDEDARLAAAFANHAAIALQNSRYLEALRISEARHRCLSQSLEETVKKKVAELQQARSLAAIGQMVSVVAHEVRNPLQNIHMGVDQMRREVGEDENKLEILEEICYGVNLLDGIIKELLDYSRPVSLEYTPLAIRDIVSRALNALTDKLRNTAIHLELEQQDREIFVDAVKMNTVLVNLISNAAEAMPNGGEVRISSQFSESDGAQVLRLFISDTGCGIEEEQLERIQEPFFTTKTNGTGLGISICKKIIDAHNGSLSVRSKVNEGTTVEIALPVRNS